MKNFIAALSFVIVFILIKLTPLNTPEYSMVNLIITISIYVIGFIITLYSSLPILIKDWKDFKLQKWHKYIFIIISFVLLFVILKAVRFFTSSILPPQTNVDEIKTVKNSFSIFSVIIASIPPLLAPFYEELAFRNNLFYQFKDKKLVAVMMAIISSIFFGAIHYYNFNSLIATIPYMFIGLYFCIIYYYKKNIFYTIIPHLLLNWMNIFLGIIGFLLMETNSI